MTSRSRARLVGLAALVLAAGCSDGGADGATPVAVHAVEWAAATLPAGTCGYARPVTVEGGSYGRPATEVEPLDYAETVTPIVDVAQVDRIELPGSGEDAVVVTVQCAGHEWDHYEVRVFVAGPGGPAMVLELDRLPCVDEDWCGVDGEIIGPPTIDGDQVDLDLLWFEDAMVGVAYGSALRARYELGEDGRLRFLAAQVLPLAGLEEVNVSPARSLVLGLQRGWDLARIARPEVLTAIAGLGGLEADVPVVFGEENPDEAGAPSVRVQQERSDGTTVAFEVSWDDDGVVTSIRPLDYLDPYEIG